MAIRSLADITQILLAGAWRRRYLICVPILVLPLLGFGVGKMIPKRYEARMTVLVQEPGKLNPFLNDLAVGPNLKDRIEGLKSLVRSEHILAQVVTGLKLAGDEPTQRQIDQAIALLAGNLTVTLMGSDLVELRLKGATAKGLDRILAAISDQFVQRLLAPERSSIESSVEFLQNEIELKRSELKAAEDALTRFRASNTDKLPELYTTNVARLAALRQALAEKKLALAGADAALDDLRLRLAGTNPVIGRLEESIVQVSGELALLRARYTEDHSEVQAALRKLRRVEEERKHLIEATRALTSEDLDRMWNLAAGSIVAADKTPPLLVAQMQRLQEAQSKRSSLRQEIEQLEQVSADLQRNVVAYGDVEREQDALTRAVTAAREVLDGLAKRYEMARVTGALGKFEAPERVKLIEPPAEPTAPNTPPPLLFLIGGLVGGIALGAGLAVVAESLDSSLRRRDQVEKALNLALLSRIPMLKMPS